MVSNVSYAQNKMDSDFKYHRPPHDYEKNKSDSDFKHEHNRQVQLQLAFDYVLLQLENRNNTLASQ